MGLGLEPAELTFMGVPRHDVKATRGGTSGVSLS